MLRVETVFSISENSTLKKKLVTFCETAPQLKTTHKNVKHKSLMAHRRKQNPIPTYVPTNPTLKNTSNNELFEKTIGGCMGWCK